MICVKKWEKKKKMLTKKHKDLIFSNYTINSIWRNYIMQRAINFEKCFMEEQLVDLIIKKNNVSTEIETLNNLIEDEETENLDELHLKLVELKETLLKIDMDITSIKDLATNNIIFLNSLSTYDIIDKYINNFTENNISSETVINSQYELLNNYLVELHKFSNLTYKLINIYNKPLEIRQLIKNYNIVNQPKLSSLLYINLQEFNKKDHKSTSEFRKLLRSLNFLGNVKKINKYKNLLRFSSLNYNFKSKNYKSSNLLKKIFLSERVIFQTNLEFFYKLHTNLNSINKAVELGLLIENRVNNKFKIYLRDFHQKPYWKTRLARILHWKLFSLKTIRKQRYKGFFDKFIKKYTKISYNYLFFFNFFSKTAISWSRLSDLESFIKCIIVESSGSLLKLPFFFSNFFSWHILLRKNFIINTKISKWMYLNFKRSQLPWLQSKKNSPKIINHIQPNAYILQSMSNWDLVTNTILLNKKIKLFTFPVKDSFKVNWQIKLHLYRYKSNHKC